MKLQHLPLWTGLLPLAGVSASYLVAASLGHVELCFPFVSGCTSISSAGRAAPESFLFRATVIPSAVLLYFYWHLNFCWLRAAGDTQTRPARILPYLGFFAAVFLVVYASVLGAIDEIYALQRRLGVTVYFSATLIAQLLFTQRLATLRKQSHLAGPGWVVTVKQWLCILMTLTGLLVIPKYVAGWDTDNFVEWNFALLTNLFYVASYFLWRDSGFKAAYRLDR